MVILVVVLVLVLALVLALLLFGVVVGVSVDVGVGVVGDPVGAGTVQTLVSFPNLVRLTRWCPGVKLTVNLSWHEVNRISYKALVDTHCSEQH